MRVHIGSDHAGLELKQFLIERLGGLGHDMVDHGPLAYDALDDYPPFCLATAAGVVAEPGSLGIVLGGSGNGEQIAANKVPGIRAALAWSVEIAELARQHNGANVVSVGSRMHSQELALEIVLAFLGTPFSGDDRHLRRINQLAAYESSRLIPQPMTD